MPWLAVGGIMQPHQPNFVFSIIQLCSVIAVSTFHAELTALCKGCTKVYIDINGTRVLHHVAQIVRLVQQVLRPKVILLKSRPMHRLACEEGKTCSRSREFGRL